MVKLRYLGNACVEIIDNSAHLIIDPAYEFEPEDGIDTILLTHEHDDHLDIDIIKKFLEKNEYNIEIYGPKSIKKKLESLDLDEQLHIIEDQDEFKTGIFKIRAFKLECYKTKSCLGYLIKKDEIAVLHTADSSEFSKRLKRLRNSVDYCFIACFKEKYEDYLRFIQDISPKVTFPYHFTSNETESAKELAEYLKEYGFESKYIEPGTEFEY